jgi:hypothetical protein
MTSAAFRRPQEAEWEALVAGLPLAICLIRQATNPGKAGQFAVNPSDLE